MSWLSRKYRPPPDLEARWADERDERDRARLLAQVTASIEARGLGPATTRQRRDGKELVLDRAGWIHAVLGFWTGATREARDVYGRPWTSGTRAA